MLMGKLVAERTGGRDSIRVFHSRQLGEESQTIEQTRVGAIDLNRINVAAIGDVAPVLNILALPFLFRSIDHLYKVIDGPIGDDILAAIEPNGFIGLTFYNSGARSIYTSTRPVRTMADLKGLRLRVQQSDLIIRMVKALGAEPVALPYGQVLTALSTKLVDGAENNWPSFVSTDHYKVAPYYTVTEHTMGPEVLVMSRRAWQELSDEDRADLPHGGAQISKFMRQQWQSWEEESQEAGDCGRGHDHRRHRPQAVRGRHRAAARGDARRSEIRAVDRADPGRAMSRWGRCCVSRDVEWSAASKPPDRRGHAIGCGPCRFAGASSRSRPSTSWSAIIFAAVIWDGAKVLTSARNDLQGTRESDRQLALLESQAGRLQSLIHRYFTQPDAELLREITDLRTSLLSTLRDGLRRSDPFGLGGRRGAGDRKVRRRLRPIAQRAGTIMSTYENQVLAPAKEMSGLYAIVEGATTERSALIWPTLSRSREASRPRWS